MFPQNRISLVLSSSGLVCLEGLALMHVLLIFYSYYIVGRYKLTVVNN